MTGLMSVPLLLILSAGLINYGSCIGYLHPGETDRSKGTFLGYFTTYAHNVTGAVFALDEEWLHVENFYYDGIGPDAFFWVGTEGDQPSPQGFLVPFPPNSSRGEVTRLPSFTYQNVLLRLPSRLKVSDLRWISVWCRRFTVNFGSMKVPSNVVLPQKRKLSEMSRLAHGVRSGNVTLLDAKTVYIPNLHYDGAAPDAYFWVGKGIPDRTGRKIPNEKKSLEVLGHYDGVDIELVLPDNLTLYDIDYLSIWCVAYRHDFGHVLIPPPSQMYLPPALGQTQVKESGSELQPVETKPEDRYSTTPQRLFSNCMQLAPQFTVEWEAGEDAVEIRLTALIDENQYMAFGLSPRPDKPVMENSDVVVTYFDTSDGSYHAVDYSITNRSPCQGTYGVCPDETIGFRNDASVINGERRDGYTSITYSRPFDTGDHHDIKIIEGRQTIVAAIGSLDRNKVAKYHTEFWTKDTVMLNLRNGVTSSCIPLNPLPAPPPKIKPWRNSIIRGVNNFTVNIGPTGGDRGYSAITSTTSWGIAWWVNNMLIPEIYVERGQTYYFKIEGGDNSANSAEYHPFYITDSKEGGYSQKTVLEQSRETVFAGVELTERGQPIPTGIGHLCMWKHKTHDRWEESETFEEYFQTLYKECEPGKPGTLEWTVPMDTPDLVYYQCYTHRHLGWKIQVNDPGYLPSERFSAAPGSARSWSALLLSMLLAVVLYR